MSDTTDESADGTEQPEHRMWLKANGKVMVSKPHEPTDGVVQSHPTQWIEGNPEPVKR